MKSSKKGYTLIEVLIASLIFSAIVMLSLYALNQGLMQYKGILERGLNLWDTARVFWLQRSLSSAIDYYIYDGRKKLWYPFFKGNLDKIAYITLSSFSHDTPVFAILKKEQINGKFNLVYYELPVYTANLKELEDILTFKTYQKAVKFVFFEDLENLNFKFYGYDRFRQFYDWFSEYDGSSFLQLPNLIKIEYTKEGKNNFLYFPINVQNLRKVFYNELYQ